MLQEIIDSTRERIPEVRRRLPDLMARAEGLPPAHDLATALTAPGLSVIAEIKRRSPSAGVLAVDMDPAGQAKLYVDGGAAAISVLTEPDYFDGAVEDLMAVREVVSVPILRKDFTLDPAQIWEARAVGADAVLLIVAVLTDVMLEELLGVASDAGLAALVEVHSAVEADRAVRVGARIIGVNNRDLTTFDTDLATAERLAPIVAAARVRVGESGVSDPEGARRMAAAGYDAILVGEALVRSDDPAGLVKILRSA